VRSGKASCEPPCSDSEGFCEAGFKDPVRRLYLRIRSAPPGRKVYLGPLPSIPSAAADSMLGYYRRLPPGAGRLRFPGREVYLGRLPGIPSAAADSMLGYYRWLPPGAGGLRSSAGGCDLRDRSSGHVLEPGGSALWRSQPPRPHFGGWRRVEGRWRLFRQRQGARYRECGFRFRLRFLRLRAGQSESVLSCENGPVALIVNAG